jgi:NAD(P)-dependent dehydrogenase (short-subunit alcohol dehydrogenase family)
LFLLNSPISPHFKMSKVWFITGSSRGLGLAIAEAALKSGASVIATARKPEQLSHLVEKYGSDKVFPIALDVTSNEDALKAVKAGHEKFGRIDIVVNNAGYADVAAVEDISIESFRAQIETTIWELYTSRKQCCLSSANKVLDISSKSLLSVEGWALQASQPTKAQNGLSVVSLVFSLRKLRLWESRSLFLNLVE